MEKYVIYRHIGDLSKPDNGWVKELNFISWNDREPVYDIRTWNGDHTKYGKGITITPKQMVTFSLGQKLFVHGIRLWIVLKMGMKQN